METEGVIWLGAIQDGSISEYLTEISELEDMKLSKRRRNTTNTIVGLNKRGIFPKKNILQKSVGYSATGLDKRIAYLKNIY